MIRPLALLVALTACGEVTTNGNDNPPPTVESLTPDRGGVPGGHTITVTGSGFTANDAGDNHVVVGDVAATEVVAADDATLTFKLPPGPAPDAVMDVVVFNNNGFAVLPDALQYSPFPVALSLSTPFVRSSGDTISIFGTGFQDLDAGDNQVTIGAVAVESVEVVSDTELEIEVAPRPDEVSPFEPLDVVVTNGNGTTTLPGAFKYTKPGLLRFEWNRNFAGPTRISFLDLDGDTVTETPITTADVAVHSAVLANNGKIYIMGRMPRVLATLDPLTGASQTIGTLSGEPQDGIRDIAFSNGKLYGLLKASNQLALIDTDDATYEPIGAAASFPEGGDTCCYPFSMTRRNDSTLWAVSGTASMLYRVNVSDSVTSNQVVLSSEQTASINALFEVDGDLYGVTKSSVVPGEVGQSLVRIDTTTGVVTRIHQFTGTQTCIAPTPPLF